MCSCINIIKAHLEKSKQKSKSGFFPIAIAYWSRLGIFRQNGENPTKLGWLDSKETQGHAADRERQKPNGSSQNENVHLPTVEAKSQYFRV